MQRRGYTDDVSGGINYLGNAFNYSGPMLWMGNLTYDNSVPADSVLGVVDRTIGRLGQQGVSQADLDLALVKLRSSLYDNLSSGQGRADMLAAFALFDNDPARINSLEAEFRKVTPAIMQQTIRDYLRQTNRTILIVNSLAKS